MGRRRISESLQYVLKPFGIHARIIEPRLIRTGFYNRPILRMDTTAPVPYCAFADRLIKTLVLYRQYGSDPAGVAETIYRAAIDRGTWLRYPAEKGRGILLLIKLMPERLFRVLVSHFSYGNPAL